MKIKQITLLLFIASLLFACKKQSGYYVNGTSATASTTTAGSATNTTNTGTYYFIGTLNGMAFSWQVTDNFTGWVLGSASSFSNAQGVITGGLTALISGSNGLKPALGVEFRTVNVSYTQDYSVYFKGFVSPGVVALATTSTYTVGKTEILITYTDVQGNYYTSAGPQTGNTANIVLVTDIPAQLGVNEKLKIKVTFSCTLYPYSGTGNSLTLKNAEATLSLENLI